MKKFIATVILTSLLTTNAQAESKAVSLLKEYGIPCGVSLLAGLLLADSSKNGLATGVAVCGGLATYGILKDSKLEKEPLSQEQQKQLDLMIQSSMEKLAVEKEKTLDEKLKQQEKLQKENIEQMKAVLRDVLAEKMISLEDEMKKSIQQQLENGTLIPKIEENMKDSIKKEVVSEIKARQKEIVEKAVEQTIKEVVAKPIGVGENQSGLID